MANDDKFPTDPRIDAFVRLWRLMVIQPDGLTAGEPNAFDAFQAVVRSVALSSRPAVRMDYGNC
jgi:hypothetical protein